MLAEARDDVLRGGEHARLEVALLRLVARVALAVGDARPPRERRVGHEGEHLERVVAVARVTRVLERGDRQEEAVDVAVRHLALHPLVQPVDVGVAVEPVVARVVPHGAEIHVHGAEDGDEAHRVLHAPRLRDLPPAVARRQELAVGDGRIGVAHHGAGPDRLAGLGDDAARSPALDPDLADARAHADLAAAAAELLQVGARDPLGAAARVVAAVVVVRRHRRVQRQRHARRRQAVIPRLRAEHAAEERVLDARVEQARQRREAPAHQRRRAERHGEDRGEAEQRLAPAHVGDDAIERVEVADDALALVREARDEPLDPAGPALGLIEALARDQEVIEAVGVELAELEIAAQTEPLPHAPHAAAGPEIADVMHAGAEPVALEREAVGPAPREVMLLEHEHLLAGARERDGGGEASGPRSDHHGVPGHSVPPGGRAPRGREARSGAPPRGRSVHGRRRRAARAGLEAGARSAADVSARGGRSSRRW